MWISRYVCYFVIFSFLGWIYETAFCTITSGRWENRGFLFGPVCPIYGSGAVAISMIMNLTDRYCIERNPWLIFIISVTGSALLEYVTSWGLERLFHALWWDYSSFPLNIHGRISLFTSLGFGCAGLLIVYYIAPFTERAMDFVPPIMTEFLGLVFCFIFAVDLTLTANALRHFDRLVTQIEDSFNRSMEAIVDNTLQQSTRIRQGIIEKGRAVNGQISSMSSFVKGTVRRVYSFRYRDKDKESTRNISLSMIRRTISKKRQTENRKDQQE